MAKHPTGVLTVGGKAVALNGNALDGAIMLANDRERINQLVSGSVELTFNPADIKLLPREKIADERRDKLDLR